MKYLLCPMPGYFWNGPGEGRFGWLRCEPRFDRLIRRGCVLTLPSVIVSPLIFAGLVVRQEFDWLAILFGVAARGYVLAHLKFQGLSLWLEPDWMWERREPNAEETQRYLRWVDT